MLRFRRNYTTLLPLLWAACCLLGYRFPGDEFSLWTLGSVAGAWVFLFTGDLSITLTVLPMLLLAGMITMWGAGRAIDRLRVPWKLWVLVALGCGALIVEALLSSFDSLDQAVEKNGSVAAYLVFGAQAGSYAATLFGMVGIGLWRLIERGRPEEGGF